MNLPRGLLKNSTFFNNAVAFSKYCIMCSRPSAVPRPVLRCAAEGTKFSPWGFGGNTPLMEGSLYEYVGCM
jgi:hypothetical protein